MWKRHTDMIDTLLESPCVPHLENIYFIGFILLLFAVITKTQISSGIKHVKNGRFSMTRPNFDQDESKNILECIFELLLTKYTHIRGL